MASLLVICLAALSAQAVPVGNGNISASEAAGMQVLYEFNVGGGLVLVTNNAGLVGPYTRVGYYLEITFGPQAGQWVYVSMDDFSGGSEAGLEPPRSPISNALNVYQTIVNNATVEASPGSGIMTTASGIATVNVEIWPWNYTTVGALGLPGENPGRYDFDDSHTGGASYTSFQVHNYNDAQTLFALNNQYREGGIGNSPVGQPDWTFQGNVPVGILQVLVGNVDSASRTVDLIADGGPDGEQIDVGDVTVTPNNDGTWTVAYDTTESGWLITEIHLSSVCEVGQFPQTRSGNPRVGKFEKQAEGLETNLHEVVINDPGCCGDGEGTTLFAAHAVVVKCEFVIINEEEVEVCREESAWGAGIGFPGKNWATYFECDICLEE